ncbi:MBOAT family protein, partial [Campylobacter upsaliensis]|nr:MBOAT family protein [Campylobacter upsaliensis]
MIYFSLEFSILMIVFFACYWFFKDSFRLQNAMILGFSYCVYSLINPLFSLILLVYTFFIHYFA